MKRFEHFVSFVRANLADQLKFSLSFCGQLIAICGGHEGDDNKSDFKFTWEAISQNNEDYHNNRLIQ